MRGRTDVSFVVGTVVPLVPGLARGSTPAFWFLLLGWGRRASAVGEERLQRGLHVETGVGGGEGDARLLDGEAHLDDLAEDVGRG